MSFRQGRDRMACAVVAVVIASGALLGPVARGALGVSDRPSAVHAGDDPIAEPAA